MVKQRLLLVGGFLIANMPLSEHDPYSLNVALRKLSKTLIQNLLECRRVFIGERTMIDDANE
jgi:glycyl-tRNA synthetase beta subunit